MTDSSSPRPLGPPRPRCVLRVGVTGHRPGPSLPDTELHRVRSQVGTLLADIGAAADAILKTHPTLFSQETPAPVAISALAEGADRILAEEALASGWMLDVVLPLGREEYEQDFATSESKADFAAILTKARAVLELQSARQQRDRDASYEAAGFVMLDHVDILVAVWDGQDGRGRGGTRQIMVEAARREIPVIWLRSDRDQPLSLWHDSTPAAPLAPDASRGKDDRGPVGALVERVTLPNRRDAAATAAM
ncbi:MAG TPA: hypothetical protein VHV77_18450, partial [Pirellulales bacterium]|nr:hypothetical protein [Pirellulales bacterium]